MNAVKISQSLKQMLVDYLTTTFDANKDGKEPELARKVRESFEAPRALTTGPFLELIYPYEQAESLRELCDKGVLSKKLLDLPCFSLSKPEPIPLDAPLYSHQSKAIHKLSVDNRSIVVSAGTGSGKTEAFSIPIVNDLLEDDTPGVRALLVYPLNALVNDQMERLRVMLKGTSITFGRFTSELPRTKVRDADALPNEVLSREEIRKDGKIPQILITNYAMLEYLLLRPEDSVLFSSGLWKYLVLDEAHTYSGAQGIEVAMLLRRLKQRLNKKPGDMMCIATSATLVNDDPNAAVDFAKSLFCEDFETDDIIFGVQNKQTANNTNDKQIEHNSDTYLHPGFEEMLEEMRKGSLSALEIATEEYPDIETIALWMEEIGLTDSDALSLVNKFQGDIPGYLYKVLSNNAELIKLRNWMIELDQPVLFEEAAEYIFPDLDVEVQGKALYHLIELGATARPSNNQLPLLPAKYHLFARSPQGVWVCLNPDCPGKDPKIDAKWSRIYSNPINRCESCEAQVFPLHLCRECGQVYIASHYKKSGREYFPATDQLNDGDKKRYLTWSEFSENRSLAEDFEDEDEDTVSEDRAPGGGTSFEQEEIHLCLQCGKLASNCTCSEQYAPAVLYEIHNYEVEKRRGQEYVRARPLDSMNECPRCRSKSKSKTEIATPISIRGVGPLANLTYELYRQLPPSSDQKKNSLAGNGRKLLSFYDSRQGAARFAAYLQDVANKQNYRHIIPKAVEKCLESDEWGDSTRPNLITLSKRAAELAWEEDLIQNDSDTELWRQRQSLTQAVRKIISPLLATKILSEFTTGRKSRQSLESMGLVGVTYFAEDKQTDFASLANTIGLSEEQVEALVGYLLDDLRYQKAVELPSGVHADDPEFGLNKGNPRIIRQGKINYGEIRWIGVTSRQYRKQYIKNILEISKLDSTDENVEKTLNDIWHWMLNIDGLLVGSAADGYRINYSHLYFDTDLEWFRCSNCQRLSYRGDSLPCPHRHCNGKLKPIVISLIQEHNYYYKLFKQSLIPIRTEEHTAQLDPDKGKEYQNLFKDGYVNVLSCSTTFEMGIDLGDLQTIVMSNVPPSVANYRQRAGRAGRRTSGTAYILTWTSDRPHDQTYYNSPIDIINGEVMVPNIILENELILQRHVNAILLSQFLRYRKKQGVDNNNLSTSGNFFDNRFSEKPHYYYIDEWVQEERDYINGQLRQYAYFLPETMHSVVENGLANFQSDLRTLNDEHYQPITNYYVEQIHILGHKLSDASISSRDSQNLQSQSRYFRVLLDRIRGSERHTSGYLINYLSNKGVLPSYSFPLHTVELMLPKEARNNEHLRLERDLRLAITEYAPGSEIVADKRIWRSKQPLFWKDTPPVREYRICEHCNHLDLGKEAGVPLSQDDNICSVCHKDQNKKSKIRSFVEPDGFIADKDSGKPATQYVNIEPNQMRSALIPASNLEEEALNKFVNLSYNPKGELLYVNEGKYGNGFSFPLKAFAFMSDEKDKSNHLSLGHIQTTNTLHIRFSGDELVHVPPPNNQSFWFSLLYAILHAASRCLQIDRQDIDGVLFPRSSRDSWEQTIVLYDNVSGGAGHVKNIKDNFLLVLDEARRILNCNDCAPDTSCYHCLRDYRNQYYHKDLIRDEALKFLDILIASQEPIKAGIPGAVRVNASAPANWLDERIRYVRQSLKIAIPNLDTRHPLGENITWLDTFGDLVNKGCDVELYLQDLPAQTPEGYSLATHLQVLMDKGLKVWEIKEMPTWQIIIDQDTQNYHRIIGSESKNEKIILSDSIGTKRLLTSTDKVAVKSIADDWKSISRRVVNRDELNPPQNVKVISVRASSYPKKEERDFFADFFGKPCVKMLVHDPYLQSRERIVNRLGNYIALAEEEGHLEKVIVHTKKAQDNEGQENARLELVGKFGDYIQFKYTAEHDRYIEVERINGERARIIIGRGLDFILPDGSTKPTYIVIQDPIS